MKYLSCILLISAIISTSCNITNKPKFKAIAFYTAQNDQAHISFVHEANQWFAQKAKENNFVYDSTNCWDSLNPSFLSKYQVVLFLDTRPEKPEQRAAFENYMKNGGAWLGFHFTAFALTPSTYNQDWDWYHKTFLGSGQYVSNTWRPTSAVLRVENHTHPLTMNLPDTFTCQPNEWYRWEYDLRQNPDIEILMSIDSSGFPVGTGPKEWEIWHSGYYPVVWTNKNYKMLYINMGHNDIDYEHNSNKELSFSFRNKIQSQFVLESLLWLGQAK